MARDMSAQGYSVVKSFEGRALKSYKDCVGVWTIGYGNTNHDQFAVSYLGRAIGPGIEITEAQADYLLHESMKRKYLPQVEAKMPGVKQPAFDAGGSFHYNTGAIGKASWVPKFLANADFKSALLSWNKGGGRVLAGLTRRREREYAMCATGNYGPEGKMSPPVLNAKGTVIKSKQKEGVAAVPKKGVPGMLRKGDAMPEVTDLQNKLTEVGFKVPVTGKFDDATETAVRAFQTAHPQLTQDGVVGPATRTQLQRELDAKRKLATGTAATGVPSASAIGADQLSFNALPQWSYWLMGAVVVGTVAYFAWQYRDEIRGWFSRKVGGASA